MATTKPAPKFDPVAELTEVETIASQLEAASSVNRETRQRSLLWKKMADTIDEAITANEGPYSELSLDGKQLEAAAEAIRKVSAALNPVAEVQWTDEHLKSLMTGVEFFLIRGVYEGEYKERAEQALANINSHRKGRGGVRAPKGEAEVIEGRPARILVTDSEGAKITEQTGNSPNSVSNITNSVRKYVESKGVALTDEQAKAVREAVRQAVEDNKSPVPVGDFAVVSHAA